MNNSSPASKSKQVDKSFIGVTEKIFPISRIYRLLNKPNRDVLHRRENTAVKEMVTRDE
jgi:hypothetical protein